MQQAQDGAALGVPVRDLAITVGGHERRTQQCSRQRAHHRHGGGDPQDLAAIGTHDGTPTTPVRRVGNQRSKAGASALPIRIA